MCLPGQLPCDSGWEDHPSGRSQWTDLDSWHGGVRHWQHEVYGSFLQLCCWLSLLFVQLGWPVNSTAVDLSNTHTQTQPFYSCLDFVRNNQAEPVQEETFSHSHLSWSSVVPYQLHPSNTIHGILPVQFMCLTVFFHNLSPSFFWSTSWSGTLHFILHAFLHPIIVFFSLHMPIPSQPVLL